MQIVFSGDYLHEKSFCFLEIKYGKYHQYVVCWFSLKSGKGKKWLMLCYSYWPEIKYKKELLF